MRNETEKTQAENEAAKLQRFAESMVAAFNAEVLEGDRNDDIYDLLDYMKNYRADCPEDIYDRATKIACELYKMGRN